MRHGWKIITRKRSGEEIPDPFNADLFGRNKTGLSSHSTNLCTSTEFRNIFISV
jgi:hypothetical protein